jgi:hypothetical protein
MIRTILRRPVLVVAIAALSGSGIGRLASVQLTASADSCGTIDRASFGAGPDSVTDSVGRDNRWNMGNGDDFARSNACDDGDQTGTNAEFGVWGNDGGDDVGGGSGGDYIGGATGATTYLVVSQPPS